MASSSFVAFPGKEHPPSPSDLRLWYSCAGVLVKIPPVNSQVYYFVQGHAEHASAAGRTVDLEMIEAVPHGILCRVQEVEYSADKDTNEVYTRILLKPVDEPIENDYTPENNAAGEYVSKKLTNTDICQRIFDATRVCAEVICPSDHDTSHDIFTNDVHGEPCTFSFISNTGWSEFITAKHLHQDDTILFMRDANKELRVGIRRANPTGEKYASADSVVGAAVLAATGKAFEVFYYPRLGTPEFVVNAARVEAATQIQCMRFLLFTIEVEDERSPTNKRTVRGMILSVEAIDRARWPDSPWKRLKVSVELTPSTTQDMRVSPWIVDIP